MWLAMREKPYTLRQLQERFGSCLATLCKDLVFLQENPIQDGETLLHTDNGRWSVKQNPGAGPGNI